MKNSILLATFTILLLVCPVKAQECTYFYPMEEGTVIELRHYDKKSKNNRNYKTGDGR